MWAALAGCVLPAAAQKPPSGGPRAVAVLRTDARGQRRLLPIAIRVEGRFYDATVYKASPVPMALDPGTVYEVQQTGDPLGLFTIQQARPGPDGAWFATGEWQDRHALEAAKNNPPPAPQPRVEKAEAEDRPVLRKAAPRDTSAPAGPPPPSTGTGSAAPNTAPPPTMGPGPQPPSGSAAPSAGAKPPPSSTPPAAPDDANVPGRPVLRRGKPAEGPADTAPKGGAVAQAGSSAAARTSFHYVPAVSDADGPEPRPFLFAPKAGEEAQLRAKVASMAEAAVAGYEKPRRPAFASARIVPGDFRMFDLDYSNQAVLVLTGSARILDRSPHRRPGASAAAAPAPDAFVTVVARQDVYGELQPVFSSVTDAQHLDEFPRLELVDAVDADGDGRGELLFRKISDSAAGWILYKSGPDKLSPLFDTFSPAD